MEWANRVASTSLRRYATVVTVTLAACGGGGNSTNNANVGGPTATAITVEGVRELNDIESNQSTFLTHNKVQIPSSISAKPGDLLIIGNKAVRILKPIGNVIERTFLYETPNGIADVYQDIIIDGTISEFSASNVLGAQQRTNKSLPTAVKQDCVGTILDGAPALQCKLQIQSDNRLYKNYEITGVAVVGLKGIFRNWNVLRGGGEGSLEFPYKFSADLSLKKDFEIVEPLPGDVCHSRRPVNGGDRIKLGTITFPVGGLFLNVPVCMVFGGKVGFSGRLIRIEDSGALRINLKAGELPHVTSAQAPKQPKLPVPSDLWKPSIDTNNFELQYLPVKASAEAVLGLEFGFEISAAQVASLGIALSATGKVFGEAEYSLAAAQRYSKIQGGIPFSQWGSEASRLCLKIGAALDIRAAIYSSLPIFLAFTPVGALGRDIFLLQPWKDEADVLGECDLRAKSEVNIVSMPKTGVFGRKVTIVAAASWSADNAKDERMGLLWKNAPLTGSIDFLAGGSRIEGCRNIPLVDGRAVCHVTFSGTGRVSLSIGAKYSGSERTLRPSIAQSRPLELRPGAGFEFKLVRVDRQEKDACVTRENLDSSYARTGVLGILLRTFDECTTYASYEIQCQGEGCLVNDEPRFWMTETTRTVDKWSVVIYDGGSNCPPEPETTTWDVTPPELTLTYSPISSNWRSFIGSSWGWPSEGNLPYWKNIVVANTDGVFDPLNTGCVRIQTRFLVKPTIRIYDSIEKLYFEETYNISYPAE